MQYDFIAGRVHNLSAGAGERLISEKVVSAGNIHFVPAALTYSNVNAFAQDEMHFAQDAVLFTIGAKLERNHFGGWGSERSANLLWTPRKHHSIWISGARSLRTPALFEIAVEGPLTSFPGSPATGGLPILLNFAASPGFSTESVNDFEAGYRAQLSKKFSADLAVFYDQYSNIRSALATSPVFAPFPVPI